MKTRVTVESITQDLARIRDGAEGALQYGAAKAAVETMAKLHGLLVDRKESGAPGDFAGMTTKEEVLAVMTTEFGAETAALLSAALARQEDKPDEVVEDIVRDEGSTLN